MDSLTNKINNLELHNNDCRDPLSQGCTRQNKSDEPDFLSNLPTEVIKIITKNISLRDCVQLKSTNKRLFDVVDLRLYAPKEIDKKNYENLSEYTGFNDGSADVEYLGAILPGLEQYSITESDKKSKIQKVYSFWEIDAGDSLSVLMYGLLENGQPFEFNIGSQMSQIGGIFGTVKIASKWEVLFNVMSMTNEKLTDFVENMSEDNSKLLKDELKDKDDAELRNILVKIFTPTNPE